MAGGTYSITIKQRGRVKMLGFRQQINNYAL